MQRCFSCLKALKYNAAHDELFCSCDRTQVVDRFTTRNLAVDSGSWGQGEFLDEVLAKIEWPTKAQVSLLEQAKAEMEVHAFSQTELLVPKPPVIALLPEPLTPTAVCKITGTRYQKILETLPDNSLVVQYGEEEHLLPVGTYEIELV